MTEQELDQLLGRFLDGRYSDADAEKLSAWVTENPDHASYLAKLSFVDWGVKRHTAMASATDFFQVLSELDADSEEIDLVEISDPSVLNRTRQQMSHRNTPRKRAEKPMRRGERSVIVIPKLAVYGPLAALLALALTILIGSLQGSDPKSPQDAEIAATPGPAVDQPVVCYVESSIAAVWGQDAPLVHKQGNAGLQAGRYRLDEGVVRLSFPNDVSVVIQSPATFSVVDANTVSLADGRLSALVASPLGHGFAVETDTLRIVDLGTEFGVYADQHAAAGVHVYDGKVQLRRQDDAAGDGQIVKNGQSATSTRDESGIRWGEADDVVVTRMDEYEALLRLSEGKATSRDRWLAHIRGMRRDKHLLAYYSFEQDTIQNGLVRNLSNAMRGRLDARMGRGTAASNPSITDSRFGAGGAMGFDRALDQALVVSDWHREVGALKHLTLAAWVRLDSQSGWHLVASQWHDYAVPDDQRYAFHLGVRCQDYPILAEGAHPTTGAVVSGPVQVPAPAPQAHISGNGEQYQYGLVNSWRDNQALWQTGQWHLVVLTIDAEQGLVSLYVDAKRVDQGQIAFATGTIPDIAQPLILGGKVTTSHEGVGMHGAIDDVAIFSRLLSADDIRALYRVGMPRESHIEAGP